MSKDARGGVILDGMLTQIPDADADESQEWVESLDAVIENAGPQRARYLLLRLLERARERQLGVPALRSTDYVSPQSAARRGRRPGHRRVRGRRDTRGPIACT